MSTARLAVAVGFLLALAIALPYTAVTSLHHRRIRAAEKTIADIQPFLAHADIRVQSHILLGPGAKPRFADSRWNDGPAYPLESLVKQTTLGPDPWGNAYVVNIGASRSGSAVWLLSAGGDGVLQTPFVVGDRGPEGDDIGRPVH